MEIIITRKVSNVYVGAKKEAHTIFIRLVATPLTDKVSASYSLVKNPDYPRHSPNHPKGEKYEYTIFSDTSYAECVDHLRIIKSVEGYWHMKNGLGRFDSEAKFVPPVTCLTMNGLCAKIKPNIFHNTDFIKTMVARYLHSNVKYDITEGITGVYIDDVNSSISFEDFALYFDIVD